MIGDVVGGRAGWRPELGTGKVVWLAALAAEGRGGVFPAVF